MTLVTALQAGFDLHRDGRLAFSKYVDGKMAIFVANADGSNPKRVSFGYGDVGPHWSPDGKTNAFLSNRESSGSDIWTIPAAGGEPKRITRPGTVDSDPPRWNPDSRMIAFTARTDKSTGNAAFVVAAGGDEPRQVTPTPSSGRRWSPDGRELAVISCPSGHCAVQVRNPDGKLLRTLSTTPNGFEQELSWSHDGSRVLVHLEDYAPGTDGAAARENAVMVSNRWPAPLRADHPPRIRP